MHLPSSDQLWHMPDFSAFPMLPGVFLRLLPLDEQETSYFADIASMLNFSLVFIVYYFGE